MGVEVIEEYFPPQQLSKKNGVEEDSTSLHKKDIKKQNHGQGLDEAIKSNSYVKNDNIKCEGNPTMDANIFPTDTSDELPTPEKTHRFYFAKFRPIEDPKLKSEIDQLDKNVKKMIRDRFEITETIRWRKFDRDQVISRLKSLNLDYKRCRMIFEEKSNEKRNEMEPMWKRRTARNKNLVRGDGLCSSVEELNHIIRSLHCRMQHQSNTLVTEKQLLGEIKQLEGTREKVIADAAMKEKIYDSWGQGKLSKIALIDIQLDAIRKEKKYINDRMKCLEEHVKAMDTEISTLQRELTTTNQKRIAEFESLNELKKQRDKWKAYYLQNCSLLNNARDLAAKKDVAALKELSRAEVENFMSLWSNDKAFRDDYVKRSLAFLDYRKLSMEEQMLIPDNRPLVSVVRENINKPKEQPTLKHETLPNDTSLKEENYELTKLESTVKEKTFALVKPPKPLSLDSTINAPKMKEMEKEENIVKVKFASASKKKLAEKAAVRATLQAPNVAEKKAKKKGRALVAPTNLEEQVESDRVLLEGEKTGDPVSSKNRDQTKKTIRYGKRLKGQDKLPKLIIKQKCLRSQWLWDVPAALLVIMFVVLGYHYLLGSLKDPRRNVIFLFPSISF